MHEEPQTQGLAWKSQEAVTEPFKRGELVRIVRCPLNNQHAGLEGEVIESAASGAAMCVELGDGSRCWTNCVEPIADAKKSPPPLQPEG